MLSAPLSTLQSTWLMWMICFRFLNLELSIPPASLIPAAHVAQVDDMVMVMDEGLRAEACSIAARLRAAGRAVDLVLEPKKMKWAFKQAERCVPSRAYSDLGAWLYEAYNHPTPRD